MGSQVLGAVVGEQQADVGIVWDIGSRCFPGMPHPLSCRCQESSSCARLGWLNKGNVKVDGDVGVDAGDRSEQSEESFQESHGRMQSSGLRSV